MRALARDYIFKKIYVDLFDDNQVGEIVDSVQYDSITLQNDKDYINCVFDLYVKNKESVEKKINDLLVDYIPERVFKIDRAILSLAIVELLYYKKTPQAVVINEAVELAKKYGTDKSYSFVNGLLKRAIEGK